MKKRILSLLLAVAMVLGMMPTNVFAAAKSAVIPNDAPFTAITTDEGPIIAIEQKEDVTFNYATAPYYIVTIPAGATAAYITAPNQLVMEDFAAGGAMKATGYAARIEDDWATEYVSYDYEESDGGPVVEVPMEMDGMCFVEDEDGYLTHAFGIEDASNACLGLISFRYGTADEGDEPPTAECPIVVTVNGNAVNVETAEDYYYVTYEQGKTAQLDVRDEEVSQVMVFNVMSLEGRSVPYDETYFLSAGDFYIQCPVDREFAETSRMTWVLIQTDENTYNLVIEATAAESEEPEHTCEYQEVVDEAYLKTAATCQSPAVYYKTCTCGVRNEEEIFTDGELGEHTIENGKCQVCGALKATKLTWWYGNNSTTEINIQEGDIVDATTGCTPKASGKIGIASADSTIASVSADEATTDGNGHATVQISGNTIGTTTITAFSKIDSSKQAELTVNVTCGHKNTQTTTTYTPVEGSESHTATTTCACGEEIGTPTTGSCVDTDTNGKCDLCGGNVKITEVSGPVCIFDSSVNGSWGTTTYLTKLYIDGVTIKSYEWSDGICTITLAEGTAADAAITFSAEGLGGNGGRAALYVNGSKSNYTINLADGKATVGVKTASSFSATSMVAAKTVTFITEGQQTVPVESITITPENPKVQAGGSLQLTANVYPENATIKDVIWSTTAPDTAITLTADGNVLGQTMGMGQYYTITATSKSNPDVKTSCQVYLDYKPETAITISAETMSIEAGDSGKLTATVIGDNFSSNKTVTWKSSDENVATVKDGMVTGKNPGKATITAASYYGLTATCEVTVKEAKHEHDYKEEVTAPTCTEGGYTTYTCTCGASYTGNETEKLGHDFGENDICTRCSTKRTVTVYFSASHDDQYMKGDGGVAALHEIAVPYFDLGLYGLERYYFSSEEYGDDGDGLPGSALTAGTAESAYGKTTMLHLFIYATETLYLGVDPEDAGQGELYKRGLVGSNVFTISGDVGSSFLNYFWNYDMNLNYYLNYQYPLASAGWGATCDQILLKDGDVITLGQFTDYAFYSDPLSIFNYIKADNPTPVQGEEATLTLYCAGPNLGTTDGTAQNLVKYMPKVYYKALNDLNNEGNVTEWEYLGCADKNGKIILDTDTLEPGQYIVAIPGQRGADNPDAVVSTPGGMILTVMKNTCEHDFESVVTNPTCVKGGYTTYTCTKNCGYSYVDNKTEMLDHSASWETVEGHAASCDEPGLTDGVKCSICNITVTAQEEIPAPGHNTNGTVAHKDATCTATGVVGGTYCDVCNYGKEAAEKVIPVIAHNTEGKVAHKDATCTVDGVVGGTYCDVCNNGKEEVEKKIPAPGHNFKDGSCTVCGAEDPNYVPKYALGDVNKDGVIDVKDANLIVSCFYGSEDLTDEQLKLADVNGDGVIDTKDANLIVSYFYGTIENFPTEG